MRVCDVCSVWYLCVGRMCSARCLCVCVSVVCKHRMRDTHANRQDLLIQDIMGCAKITSEILVLGFWSRTFLDTWEWAQIAGEMGQKGRETGASIGCFY